MLPSLDIGPLSFPSYLTLLAAAVTAGVLLAWHEAPSAGVARRDLLVLSVVAIGFGLLGARLLHVLADGYLLDYVHLCTDPTRVGGRLLPHGTRCTTDVQCVSASLGELCNASRGTCHPGQDCLRVFELWKGGFALYGGFIAAAPAALVLMRRRGMHALRTSDLLAAPVALGLVIGRIGCLLAGCCFGRPTSSPMGLAFHAGSPAWKKQVEDGLLDSRAMASLPVHPTQLYEAAVALLLFAWLHGWLRTRRRYDGQLFLHLVAGYGVARFALELLRSDNRGEWLSGLVSTSQLIAVPLVAAAFVTMGALRRQGRSAHVP